MGGAVAVEGELLARDIHPADLLLPSGALLRGVRVFITSHRLIAYLEKPSGGIEVAADLPLSVIHSIEPSRNSLSPSARIIVEVEGGSAFVNRGQGCGCHSALKALSAPIGWTP